jgi:hypothetical protein
MSTPIAPVFLLSLPRSGSTLLQKIIASHPEVSSEAEPWIMLPLAAMTGEANGAVYAEYSHHLAVRAIDELLATSPQGREHYYRQLNAMLNGLYAEFAREGCRYFLDKTPRYFLIIDFIYKVFPDAKVIFLFRSPVESLASMVETWWGGVLKTYHLQMDLELGPRLMAEGYLRHRDKALALHYQDLVTAPETTVRQVCAYLGLEFREGMIADFQRTTFSGSMGDPTGVHTYRSISTEPMQKWRAVLNNPVRRGYARRLVAGYSAETQQLFRIDPVTLQAGFAQQRGSLKGLWRDLAWVVITAVARRFGLHAVLGQWRRKAPYKIS